MYQASVPAFLQTLNNLSAILDKAEAYAGSRKIDPEVLLNYRLAPDMFFVTAHSDEEGLAERIQRQVPGAPPLSKPLYGHRLADTIAQMTKPVPSLNAQRSALSPGPI